MPHMKLSARTTALVASGGSLFLTSCDGPVEDPIALGVAIVSAVAAVSGVVVARRAQATASRNARSLKVLEVSLDRRRVFESNLEKLRSHRKAFHDKLCAIEGVAKSRKDGDADTVLQRSRMLSRSFRAAMERYGESWEIFQALTPDLDRAAVEDLENLMRSAAGVFSQHLDATQLLSVVEAHAGVLERLVATADEGLARLKDDIEGAVDDGPKPPRASSA